MCQRVAAPGTDQLTQDELMKEVWLPVRGYEGLYEVSDLGRVRSVDRTIEHRGRRGTLRTLCLKGRVLRGSLSGLKPYCYKAVALSKEGRVRTWRIHTLVAQAFVPGELAGREVNHKDCDKLNNAAENLEWVTHKDNQRHAADSGRMGHDGWKQRKRSPTGTFLS